MTPTNTVLAEVRAERKRQVEKWGVQHHPLGTGGRRAMEIANAYRTFCERQFKAGAGTWKDILLEEVFEALAEAKPEQARAELIQVAAVAVACIEDIDSREEAK